MSTNFYLYDRRAFEAGVPTDRLVGIHVAKRTYGGEDVGVVFTLQAVVTSQWDRVWDFYRESPYWSPVDDFPAVISWDDWLGVLVDDDSWILVDEYGVPVDRGDFVQSVETSARSAPYERHMRWLSENAGRTPSVSGNGHYLDDEGYSMCWWNFS